MNENNKMYGHYMALKNYVFAKKYNTKNGGFFYQLFCISEHSCKIGTNENGFVLQHIDGTKSNDVATVETLYKCIRYQKNDFIAFQYTDFS